MSILDEEDVLVNADDRVILFQKAREWLEENCGDEVMSPGETFFTSPVIIEPFPVENDGISSKVELEYMNDKVEVRLLNKKYFLYIKNLSIIPDYLKLDLDNCIFVSQEGTRYKKDEMGKITWRSTIYNRGTYGL